MARKSKKAMAQDLFLEMYAATGSITRAFDELRARGEYGQKEGETDQDRLKEAALIQSLPLHRQRHYEWIVEDGAAGESYRERFFAADETATQVLEGEAFRRAYEGVEDFKLDRDGMRHFFRRYSDTCLIFLLKARRPDRYRERFDHRHAGAVGAPPIGLNVTNRDAVEGDELDDDFVADAWGALVAASTGEGEGPTEPAGPEEPLHTE